MKNLNLVNTIAEYNELKSNYDSIDPYVCYVQDEKLAMYDGVPSTWQIRYTSSDGNIVLPTTNIFDNVNIVSNIYRDDEGIIVFDNSITSIEKKAFYGCRSLTSISIPNSVTSIGNNAFYYCTSLTSITIPNSVTFIDMAPFTYCESLTSITIPSSVTKIGKEPFSYCPSLTSIEVDANNPNYASIDGVLYNKDVTTLICFPGGKTSISIPNSVTSIGFHAFYGCKSLTSISIPNSVTSIGSSAFHACSSLTSISIGNSVTSIEFMAFQSCSSLASITIPNSVNSIGQLAFYKCTSLTSITINRSTPPVAGKSMFERTNSNLIIYVPDESVDTYKDATNWREYASQIKPLSLKPV